MLEPEHTHTHIGTHCARSSGSYHYPSLHPPFGISRPDRSWPITVSLQAVLSISISRSLISYSLYLFFTPYLLSLCLQPPHTTLLCPQTVSVSKLLKSLAYPVLAVFLALLSPRYFLSISCPPTLVNTYNLPLTPH